MTSDPLTPPQRSVRQTLALLIAMTSSAALSINIFVPALPSLISVFDTDIRTVQLTLSLFLISLATSQLVLGPLSDRFGRRPVVIGGLTLATLAPLAGSFAWSIEALIGARILHAFGAATGLVMGRAMVRDLYERDRAAAILGLVVMVMMIAPMVAPLIGGLLDTALGWHAILWFDCAYSLLVLAASILILPETRPARPAESGFLSDAKALFSARPFNGYVLCGVFGSAPYYTFLGGAPHVMVSVYGRSTAEYGLWVIPVACGYMFGNFLTTRLSHRHGVDAMILVGLVISAVGVVAGTLVAYTGWLPGPGPMFAGQIVYAVGTGLVMPNTMAGAVSVRPLAAGAGAGIIGFSTMAVGGVLAQAITFGIANARTEFPLDIIMVVQAVLGIGIYGLLLRKRRRLPV